MIRIIAVSTFHASSFLMVLNGCEKDESIAAI